MASFAMHTNYLATKRRECCWCAWRQGEYLSSIVDSVFELNLMNHSIQPILHIHLLRKPVRTDLLLCNRWQNSVHLLLTRQSYSRHNLVSAQSHAEAMTAPLTTALYITRHATLNPIACMCQTMCDVTSSNVLGRLVQCEHKLSMV